MTQISTAIGSEIPAICSLFKKDGTAGKKRPIATPAAMQPNTHQLRFFWKELMPLTSLFINIIPFIETFNYFYI